MSGRRGLHPGAWWLWAACMAGAASRTTNPVLLLLIGAWSPSWCPPAAPLGTVVALDRGVPPAGARGHRDPGGPGDRVRQPPARPRALHPAPGPPAVVGGRCQHRRSGHRRGGPPGRRAGTAPRRGPDLLRRGELAGQPVPAPPLPARRAVRGRGRHHRVPGLRPRTGHGHRRRPGRPATAGPARSGACPGLRGMAVPVLESGPRPVVATGLVHGCAGLWPAGAGHPGGPAMRHRGRRRPACSLVVSRSLRRAGGRLAPRRGDPVRRRRRGPGRRGPRRRRSADQPHPLPAGPLAQARVAGERLGCWSSSAAMVAAGCLGVPGLQFVVYPLGPPTLPLAGRGGDPGRAAAGVGRRGRRSDASAAGGRVHRSTVPRHVPGPAAVPSAAVHGPGGSAA